MFEVYVLENERSGKIYIGQTSDYTKRIKRHNGEITSKSRSYTKINKGKWILVHKEGYNSRQEAINREKYLKSHIGRDWLRFKVLGP